MKKFKFLIVCLILVAFMTSCNCGGGKQNVEQLYGGGKILEKNIGNELTIQLNDTVIEVDTWDYYYDKYKVGDIIECDNTIDMNEPVDNIDMDNPIEVVAY